MVEWTPWRRITTEIAQALTEVAAGIHRLRLPLPFPTQSVNAYIIQTRTGVDLVDTGDLPQRHAEYWAAALRHLGIDPSQVKGIYVTHHHIDHFGSAKHLRDRTGAPVYVLDRDLEEARRSGESAQRHRRELAEMLIRHGMPTELAQGWLAGLGPARQPEDLPALITLTDREVITLGGEEYRVVWAPGHCDGQYCLYSPDRKLLFGADHLLQKMVPPLLQAPHRRPDLVGDYLASLAKVEELDVDLILPGHGGPFPDLPGHVQRMREQVEQRLARIVSALSTPSTAFALIPVLYPRASRVEQQRYVQAEIISYLEYLAAQGRAVRRETEARQIVYAAGDWV